MTWANTTNQSEETGESTSEDIRRKTEMEIAYYAQHPELIEQRLSELDQEWDIDRALLAVGAGASLFGLLYGLTFSSKWLVLPLAAQGFALQHALTGQGPPMQLKRRTGMRTRREINPERFALKALRGDFQDLPTGATERGTTPVLQAVER